MLELAYSLLIALGLVMLAALFYLRGQTQGRVGALLELTDLNAAENHDPRKLIARIDERLERLGLRDWSYDIEFLDNRFERLPRAGARRIYKETTYDDYRIRLGIQPRRHRGEHAYMNRMVLDVLVMLVETDVLLRIKIVNETFHRYSRLQSFLLHDIKNLAQFIDGLAYNIAQLSSDERERRLVATLKDSLPALSMRAGRVIRMLELRSVEGVSSPPVERTTVVRLRELIERLARPYQFAAFTMAGDAEVSADPDMLSTVLDALLKNAYDKSHAEPALVVRVTILKAPGGLTIEFADNGSPVRSPERLFEPFYSTSPGGSGIGLYQARHLLRHMGGDLDHVPSKHCVVFRVRLSTGAHT